jgi:VanZ family protein
MWNSRLGRRLWVWGPVVVWLGVIALESTPMFGSDHTNGPLERLFALFHGPFTPSQWWEWHHAIRKTGHVLGYGTFAVIFFRAYWLSFAGWASQVFRRLDSHLLALTSTFVVASLDEWHQTFLPNRTGRFADVLIDLSGAIVFQLLVIAWSPR